MKRSVVQVTLFVLLILNFLFWDYLPYPNRSEAHIISIVLLVGMLLAGIKPEAIK
jgi:hypothetical protein